MGCNVPRKKISSNKAGINAMTIIFKNNAFVSFISSMRSSSFSLASEPKLLFSPGGILIDWLRYNKNEAMKVQLANKKGSNNQVREIAGSLKVQKSPAR